MPRRSRESEIREWKRVAEVIGVQLLAVAALVGAYLIADAILDLSAMWRTTDFQSAIEGGRP